MGRFRQRAGACREELRLGYRASMGHGQVLFSAVPGIGGSMRTHVGASVVSFTSGTRRIAIGRWSPDRPARKSIAPDAPS